MSDKKSDSTLKFALKCCVVLLAIIVLAALLFPPEYVPREVSRRIQCTNNAKVIGWGLHNHVDTRHDGKFDKFPPAYSVDENGKPLHSWRVLILQYLDRDEQQLYDQIRLDEPWDSEYNRQFHDKMPSFYWCPAANLDAKEKGLTSYQMVVGPNTISGGADSKTLDDVTAGEGNVIWLVEVIPTTCWMAPVDVQESELSGNFRCSRESGVGSMHPSSGITVGFLDGSVEYMPKNEASQLQEKVKIKQ